jgi:Ca-activated chloride channel family protein
MRFEHPHLLWLLPLLPALVLLFLWWSNRVRQRLLQQFIHSRLLPELTVGISPARQRARAILFAGAAALIVLALARPQWGFSWEEARQKGLDIVVAIDTSKSMLAEDIKPNRLARAKLAALDLMQQARADRLGVVAFAGGAFLQCPLTLDDGAFRQCLDELNVNTIPQGGTALAEAIRTATQAFKEDDNFKVLVLFTDGEDHDPGALEAAAEASRAGMRIFTIGLGTEQGEILRLRNEQGKVDYVRDAEGQVVKSRLNESILQQIAGTAQGFYLPLRGADTVDTLYEKGLAPLPKSESEERLFRRYHEQFHWPLGLAILLLLIETVLPERKREIAAQPSSPTGALAAALTLLLLCLPERALASAASATREFDAGNFEQALEEFDRLTEKHGEDPRLQYNAGVAAYRAGRYDDAITRYGLATGAQDLQLQQQAYYNRGNALYRAGEQQSEAPRKQESWEQALKDYEAALKLNSADQDARFNLDFVKQRLEELKQQQQQPDQKDQQDQEDKKEDQKSDDQQQDKQQQDQQSSQDQNKDEQENSQDDSQNQQDQDSGKQDQQEQQNKDQQDQQSSEQQGQPDQGKEPSEQQGSPEDSQEKSQPDQDQTGQPGQPSNMSPEQAARLLDNLKGEEQMLPVRLMSPQSKNPPAKDW